MNKKGFTLIELLITIAIIGILAAIAIPGYIGQQRGARRTEAYTNLQNLRLLEEQFFADNGCYQPLAGGPPPVCPVAAGNIGNAGASRATAVANIPLIQAVLPRFQPGNANSLGYSYEILQNKCLVANPQVPLLPANIITVGCPASCFIAVATGVTGTTIAGDIFAIDCNNNKNF